MPVSSPGPGWCPETSNGQHSVSWYDGAACGNCGQVGPKPDDYLWPASGGQLFPAAVPAITWRADDWTGRPYDPEDPGPEDAL
jgi:hypothetical protein